VNRLLLHLPAQDTTLLLHCTYTLLLPHVCVKMPHGDGLAPTEEERERDRECAHRVNPLLARTNISTHTFDYVSHHFPLSLSLSLSLPVCLRLRLLELDKNTRTDVKVKLTLDLLLPPSSPHRLLSL
jgi:hypothetical protein